MLTFLYDAHLSPDRLIGVVPGAEFLCAAHLPDTRIENVDATPTVAPAEGETVWGAVFSIPEGELTKLDSSQAEDGRIRQNGFRPIDRDGNVHDAVTYVASRAAAPAGTARDHLTAMVEGGRHWGLPPGWVAGLEELVDEG